MVKRIGSVVLVLGLSGCVMGPDHVRPETDLPDGWGGANVEASPAARIDPQWWRGFGDPILTSLVEEALAGNADVSLAAARVAEARAVLNLRDAERYPLLRAQASGARQRSSEDTAVPGGGQVIGDFSAAAVLSYEIDLWGRLARANEAARASSSPGSRLRTRCGSPLPRMWPRAISTCARWTSNSTLRSARCRRDRIAIGSRNRAIGTVRSRSWRSVRLNRSWQPLKPSFRRCTNKERCKSMP